MAQKRKLDYYDDDFDFDTESLSSFESDEDFVHSISSSEDDTSDEENFSSVRQWCKIDSSSPAPSRFSFTGNRDYTGMWVRLGSTDLMAGKVMFLRSNQGDRLDGNESVADSFRSDLVGFKSWSAKIIGAFLPSYVCQKKPPVGKRTRYPSCQVIYSQFGLAIHQNDHQARRRFVEWAQNEIAVVPDFHKRILFSDEAHFWLNGYVKQNCRIWSEANPQVHVETPLHPEKLTVLCTLYTGGIIGPYFFKNDEGHNVTVNGDRYRAMITNFFIPELNNHDVQALWFQQDGATCHTARARIDLLKDTFGDRLISRFGPVNWPPRSCDLTPLDYFLWGYVKSLVYADKPQTLEHLEDNIRRVIADIWPQMLEKVIENWTSRLDYIRASRGSHMPEIIFKIRFVVFFFNHWNSGEMAELNEIGNVVEEVVDLARQINVEVDSNDVQERMHYHNQELTIDELMKMHEQEQDIEELES
ncbi:transposase [Trichonephila clavipes]|nr:transposase [Trichonephila clavipes]